MITARVIIMPKPTVMDPQGAAVARGARALGYGEVAEVRVGKVVELKLNEADPAVAQHRIEALCRELLANAVIEHFRLELVTGEGA